ncbi:hypothetical protein Aple_046610 [Acrocarpospora pleiomorpha]|uniref:SnoaL-like domain-containing protein n=1 Tax=Acrocarpospora pleiomorpha TaxID=90975 RepID=A0A5M3XK33_9ACTN|nr:nuclear transport factor 2 family protein [Acrocarpospora pleiomorpha]GES21765.1 hypothetical protein Aple_046610 [Acrocarpospora pleiomorpha]
MNARETFAAWQEAVLTNGSIDHLFADDAIVELPFNPGRPRLNRAEFLTLASARATLPVQFDEFRDLVIHDTSDPEVIIAEYSIAGTHTTTGHQATAPFVMILRVRNGQVLQLREYQDVPTMTAALAPA